MNNLIINTKMQKLIKLAKVNNSGNDLYPQLVDYLIRQSYSQNQVEAILNNYLDDNTNEKYVKEFEDLQAYRKACKEYAKNILEIK